jgi:SAM-dependent methyltransferase
MKLNLSFKKYAQYYDFIYQDKNYNGECNFIEEIFEINKKPKNILELGCGTGNYTKILLSRGYEVTGVDISGEMLEIASEKCSAKFIKGDIRTIKIGDKFDCCLAIFAVMGYITKNRDIIKTLVNIRKHLKPNGIFIFDVWNGLNVMRILPEQRIKKLENDEVKIIRYAIPNLIAFEHICEVNYNLLILNKKENTYREINEKHTVRYYFPQEIIYYLKKSGFEVINICPFLDLKGKVDQNVWNMCIIAKAKGD